MEGKKPDNYHWTESNISEWAENRIKKELESRGYEVQRTDMTVKLCQRMNTLGLVYMISFDSVKDGERYGIKDFYSTSEKAEGMEHFGWFLDFFKEMEVEAVLKFGSRVLDVGKEVERKSCGVKSIDAPEVKTRDLSYSTCINCSPDEIRDFVSKREFISMWSGGRASFEGDDIVLENTIINCLNEENGAITMGWKFRTWNEFSAVKITFEVLMGNTKIVVTQKSVPIKEAQSVKMWWHERMFVPISACFGFVLKSAE